MRSDSAGGPEELIPRIEAVLTRYLGPIAPNLLQSQVALLDIRPENLEEDIDVLAYQLGEAAQSFLGRFAYDMVDEIRFLADDEKEVGGAVMRVLLRHLGSRAPDVAANCARRMRIHYSSLGPHHLDKFTELVTKRTALLLDKKQGVLMRRELRSIRHWALA